MKVFISWSGDASKVLAEALKDFIPLVIQHTDVFFSPEMEAGIDWFSKIAQKLDESDFGVICLTRSNMEKPWILFEAGALAGKFRRNLVPLAIDFEKDGLRSPLNMYNATVTGKDDIYKIIQTINKNNDLVISDKGLKITFDHMWPVLEEGIKKAKALADKKPEKEKAPPISPEEKMDEILTFIRAGKNQSRPMPNILNNTRLLNNTMSDAFGTVDLANCSDNEEVNLGFIKKRVEIMLNKGIPKTTIYEKYPSNLYGYITQVINEYYEDVVDFSQFNQED